MSFYSNLNWRASVKEFNNKKISKKNLDKILKSIQMAPSSFGIQPYKIFISGNMKKNIELQKFARGNETKLSTCSHLLVFCQKLDIAKRGEKYANLKFKNNKKEKDAFIFRLKMSVKNIQEWTRAQTYIALGFALAICCELKIDSSPIEGFDAAGLKKKLDLDENTSPVVLLALGYRLNKNENLLKIRFSHKDLFQ